MAQYDEHIFAEILRDKALIKTFPIQVLDEINGLGKLAKRNATLSHETIEVLTDYLDFRADTASPDMYRERISRLTELNIFPAMLSLYYTGDEALPAVIKVIQNEDNNSLKFKNALWTIIFIKNADFQNTYDYLQEAAHLSQTVQGKKKLLFAANTVASYNPEIRDNEL